MTIDFSEEREPHQLIRENVIIVRGGLVPPVFVDFWTRRERERHEIHVNGLVHLRYDRSIRGRIRQVLAWDKDWGCRFVGGYIPNLRDLLPPFKAVRGGIRFARVEGFDEPTD